MGSFEQTSQEEEPWSWQPLSARSGGTPIDETWQERIPPWIDQAVRRWLSTYLSPVETHERLKARLHVNRTDVTVTETTSFLTAEELLDYVDGVLHIRAQSEPPEWYGADTLETLLREGHSIWRVSDTYDSLERRQDATVTSAAHRSTRSARSAGRPAAAVRLEAAWSAVYGLHPEPSKAFGQAILAVEAVAVPAIVPNKPDATLGHVLGQLSDQGHLYELAIVDKTGALSSVDSVTELIRLLWHGHTDRHEGNRSALSITQDAAEMAVHAAAVLVQWFSSGAIRRKTPHRS